MDGDPFLKIISQVFDREVSLEVGENLAAQPTVTASLQLGDILELSKTNRRFAKDGDSRQALTLQRLLLAIIEAKSISSFEPEGSNNAHYMWTTVGTDLLVIIHYEIIRMPDGRLLSLARCVGNVAVTHAKYAEVPAPAGRILRQLGGLHLDPYVVGPQYQSPDDPRQRWLQRLRDERGDELLTLPDTELVMPAPVDALQRAVDYLEDAVPMLERHDRGAAIKALTEALIALDRRGVPIDHQVLKTKAEEALTLLDPNIVPQDIVQIHNWLAYLARS